MSLAVHHDVVPGRLGASLRHILLCILMNKYTIGILHKMQE